MRKSSIDERIPELADRYSQERKGQPGFSDLEFLGAGGEQVVFAVAQKEGKEGNYRDLVVKADMRYLRMSVVNHVLEQMDHLSTRPLKYSHVSLRATHGSEAIPRITRKQRDCFVVELLAMTKNRVFQRSQYKP